MLNASRGEQSPDPESAQARREILKSGGVIAHTAARLLAADTNDPSVRPAGRPASEGAELKMMAAEQLWRGGREEGRKKERA